MPTVQTELQKILDADKVQKRVEVRPSLNGLGESFFIQDRKKVWQPFAYVWANPFVTKQLVSNMIFMGDIDGTRLEVPKP